MATEIPVGKILSFIREPMSSSILSNLPNEVVESIKNLLWMKIAVVGNSHTGKTSLIRCFCEHKFYSGYQPTIGVDYGYKLCSVDNREARVQLWDFGGAQEYFDVRNELYENTDALVLVCDVTDERSIAALPDWLREFDNFSHSSTEPEKLLVANKVDVKTRTVNPVDVRRFAESQGLHYCECSAATPEMGHLPADPNLATRIAAGQQGAPPGPPVAPPSKRDTSNKVDAAFTSLIARVIQRRERDSGGAPAPSVQNKSSNTTKLAI